MSATAEPTSAQGGPVSMTPIAPFLAHASLLYLTVPLLVFLLWWVRAGVNVAAAAGVAFALVHAVQGVTRTAHAARAWWRAHRSQSIAVGSALMCVLVFLGIGGLNSQTWDWEKHNAVLVALIKSPWPATVTLDDGERPLVYYLSYYLPAAVMGKATGSWLVTNIALLLWTWLGTLLAFGWFAYLAGGLRAWLVPVFVLTSGADLLTYGITSTVRALLSIPNGPQRVDIERWFPTLQFSAFATDLAFVPQHALAGWIGAGVLMYWRAAGGAPAAIGLLLVAVASWSPFAAVGLAVMVAIHLLLSRARGVFALPNIAVVPAGGILIAFAASTAAGAGSDSGWIFLRPYGTSVAPGLQLIGWLAVNLCECALFLWLADRARVLHPDERRFAVAAVIANALMTLWTVGYNNDWGMRASIPALFIVMALWARALGTVRGRSRWLFLSLFAGTLAVPRQVLQQSTWLRRGRCRVLMSLSEVPDMRAGRASKDIDVEYYVGKPRAFFFRVLSR